MKTSTKIIIGLVAATLAAALLIPIILGSLAKSHLRQEKIMTGPIRSIVVATDGTDGEDYGRAFSCIVREGDTNMVEYDVEWPAQHDPSIVYDEKSGTLTINDNPMVFTPGTVRVTVKRGQLASLTGTNYSVITLDDLQLGNLRSEGAAKLYINNCRIDTLMTRIDDYYGGVMLDASNIGALLYYTDMEHPAKTISWGSNSTVGLYAALPGSDTIEPDRYDDEAGSPEAEDGDDIPADGDTLIVRL